MGFCGQIPWLRAEGAGATPAVNYGQIGGATLELLFHNGLVNGLDPGVPANRGNAADIFASGSLTIQMDNGSSLTNYAKIESGTDLLISFIGGGSLLNQMSMLPDSELEWVWDRQPSTITRGGSDLLQTGQNNSVDKTVFLVGDPAKPGPYTLRLKFPKGFKIAPHTHPDSREVTILSGIFATGYGEKFDAANLKVLPAGSFYTEPANVPHYIQIEEDTILQVSGTGPSGRRFVDRSEGSK